MDHCSDLAVESLARFRSDLQSAAQWVQENPALATFVLSLLFSIGSLAFLHIDTKRRNVLRSTKIEQGGSRSNLKANTRPFGKWEPIDFKMPPIEPYPDWSVRDTKPLPYRPFRWGPYHITMGLRSLDFQDWIEIDNQWPKFYADKQRRIAERGPRLTKTAPGAFDAAIEFLEELCNYLPQRYPSMFRKTEAGMDNLLTDETYNIIERPLKEDPMQLAGRMLQDDLAIMMEKDDGQYYLLAGSIMLAGFWRLEDKFAMPLSEIHSSGNVPGFKTKLEKGMMNFFRRIQPNAPVARNNYFIQVDDNLAWSDSIGSEDQAGHGNGAMEAVHTAKTGWNSVSKNKAVEHHWFRSERQTLRRLPRTGGVVFTIRTYFHPITEVAQEPGVPGRLASAVRSWGDDTARYKGKERYQEVLLEYLDRKHEEQIANGIVSPEVEPENTNYPW